VAPINGYNAPKDLPVEVDGKTYDVLAYNPAGARKLLGRAGFPNGLGPDGRRLTIEYLFSSLPYSQPIAEILQQQWRRNLNIEMRLVKEEFKVWVGDYIAGNFSVTETGGGGEYLDPNAWLETFVSPGTGSNGWSDRRYDTMLAEANATVDPATRMHRLAQCETYLLKAMPILPLIFNTNVYLQKPFVHGLDFNPLDFHPFKYAWIDTKWKLEAERQQMSKK
jgi:oligopeptide transport system substrate-binding protein